MRAVTLFMSLVFSCAMARPGVAEGLESALDARFWPEGGDGAAPGLVAFEGGLLGWDRRHLAVYALVPAMPRGTIVLCHGYQARAVSFLPLMKRLAASGWAIIALDLPGHGNSYGPANTVTSFSEYGEALSLVANLARNELPAPLIALGHSLGGLAVIDATVGHRDPFSESRTFDAIILVAPLTQVLCWPLVRAVSLVFSPFSLVVPGSSVPISWVMGLDKWRRNADGFMPLAIPILTIFPALDTAVDASDARSLLGRIFPASTFMVISGIGHWELERADPDHGLLEAIDGFLESW